jgi:hypothetical protein
MRGYNACDLEAWTPRNRAAAHVTQLLLAAAFDARLAPSDESRGSRESV